jgi:hypothetical protein
MTPFWGIYCNKVAECCRANPTTDEYAEERISIRIANACYSAESGFCRLVGSRVSAKSWLAVTGLVLRHADVSR